MLEQGTFKMPVKSPYAKFMKHLKTKNPVPIGKRTAMSPINNYLTQMEFKMMLPPKLKDSVRVKGATSEIGERIYKINIKERFILFLLLEFDCVPLMTIALSCLKSHNYEQANCSKEIDEFKNCNKVYQVINLFSIQCLPEIVCFFDLF